MAQKKRSARVIIIFLLFVVYFLAAARPIPLETILAPRWVSSLLVSSSLSANSPSDEGDSPEAGLSWNVADRLLPFTLQERFGYVDTSGQFAINKIMTGNIYLSQNMWTEYTAEPASVEIKDIFEETIINIENPAGYPVLLDNRVFIMGSEQNSLSAIGDDGEILWTYDFGAPLTCIDAAAGLVLTGSIDGVIEILDNEGQRIFYFEPGGSRYEVILGCAISRSGSRVGVICGIDQQRFLLFESYENNGEYKVVYHEFLEGNIRRPVRILFIDEDQRIVFERTGGIGCYNINSRRRIFIPLDGEIAAIDDSGGGGFFFLITSHSHQQKKLVGVRFTQDRWFQVFQSTGAQGAVFLRALFKSDDVFLGRTGSTLVAGGGSTLISFELEER